MGIGVLRWDPASGDLTDWIRAWERLVFGGRVSGYRLHEAVEERYHMREHERPLSGTAEAAELLARLGGTSVRAVAGEGALRFTGDGSGDLGGYYSVHADGEDGAVGELPWSGVFPTPPETVRWLAALSETLLGVPFAARPWKLPYETPAHITLRSVSAGHFFAFETRTGTRQLDVLVDVRDFRQGVWPLLVPHVLQTPTVTSSMALHHWLNPLITALLGMPVRLPPADDPFPEPMTARVADARRGQLRLTVGPVGISWLRGPGDVAPLLNPLIYRSHDPRHPTDLAAWLDTVGAAVFPDAEPDEVTWSSNWPALTSPFKTSGPAARVAENLFALGTPTTCRVDRVDGDLAELVIPTPAREVRLAGWRTSTGPLIRAA